MQSSIPWPPELEAPKEYTKPSLSVFFFTRNLFFFSSTPSSNLNRPLKPAHNGYMLIKHFLLTQLLARKRKKRKRAMGLAVWLKTLRQTP